MVRFDAEKSVQFCDGIRRRDFLHAGSLGFLGLSLPDLFALKARGAVDSEKVRNCIFLTLLGGPSQLDTWDMKPNAPAEVRGPFRPIKTNVPGIEISEIFPRVAKHADKFALARSVYHTGAAVHGAGLQLMQTGRFFQDDKEYPNVGCILSKMQGSRGGLPPHALIPRPIGGDIGAAANGQSAGFLGKQFAPFTIEAAPYLNSRGPGAPPSNYISALRAGRGGLREVVDGAIKDFEAGAGVMDDNFHRAYTLLSSARAREAFDLSKESDTTKNRYGRNRFGMSCLLARRLVERGVRFVTVNQFEALHKEITWDIHGAPPFSSINDYRDEVGPMFDNAYASLLEDLSDRGLLQSTLVVATGEFGRAPKLNPMGGRDHWPHCWTMLFAGGGVKGGQVVGASDESGAYPKDRPITPAEVAATMLRSLGIDLDTELPDLQGRPIRILEDGVGPIRELF
jgi:hypothetical protein